MATLQEYLIEQNMSQRAFARQAGLTSAYVSALVRRVINPTVDRAAQIERATDGAVPIASWARSREDPATPEGTAQ